MLILSQFSSLFYLVNPKLITVNLNLDPDQQAM